MEFVLYFNILKQKHFCIKYAFKYWLLVPKYDAW